MKLPKQSQPVVKTTTTKKIKVQGGVKKISVKKGGCGCSS